MSMSKKLGAEFELQWALSPTTMTDAQRGAYSNQNPIEGKEL